MKKMRIVALLLAFIGLLLIAAFIYYQYNISPVDISSNANIEVVIPEGMSTNNIAKTLKDKDLIKSEFFFKVYLRLNNVNSLKASTYLLTKSMSLDEIVNDLEKGTANEDVIRLTFREGETITDYANLIAESTNITSEEFINTTKDQTLLSTLINDYWFLTDEILNEDIYYPLEGYLFPDTYEFAKDNLTSEEIIRTLLDEEESKLEPYKEHLMDTNIHSIITLASIAELEGVKDEDRKLIISVFNNRLELGMNLGSDVTTYYAFNEEMDSDLTSEMFNTYNPYNTRSSEMAGRLPVGPICNPSISSIEATINPEVSDYLYFVADKNRNVYFTRSASEHEAKVQELKENGDWIW
ncbi:MAG TPA: endolytic transglycosylase MltG [Candidatus Onthousia faecipullorum]|uniref:Endolytic murein transglycosylase n=1 Tax=Candidatus Onthousia faecipullorum TaxID=2840887 RepID=A0A9D1GCB3_9FIRM|nr:endolytic transglycosylase MltG [Candidatus Onthousia faecipullorum]